MHFGKGGSMFLLRMVLVLVFTVILFMMAKVVREARKHRNGLVSPVLHKIWARRTFYVVIISVVGTEIFVRLKGGLENKTLFFVHLGFAVPFILILFVLQFMTGRERPVVHRKLGYACSIFYLGTYSTGLYLIFS